MPQTLAPAGARSFKADGARKDRLVTIQAVKARRFYLLEKVSGNQKRAELMFEFFFSFHRGAWLGKPREICLGTW